MAFDHFYYEEQLKTYLTQFMAIFSGMQVRVGKRDSEEERLIAVPIKHGNKDRVVAHIISEGTQNKLLRLPIMSAVYTGINMSPELRKGVGQERRQTYMPRGGEFPTDISTVQQMMPVPYQATTELAIYTSNYDQRMQIMEQIMMIFDPIVQIQLNDAPFDWTKITTVELESISLDDNYPVGTDRRILVSTLNFTFPIQIQAPANVKDDYIKDIFVRIGAVSQGSNTTAEMIDDLDGQGLEYEKWFSLDDVILPE